MIKFLGYCCSIMTLKCASDSVDNTDLPRPVGRFQNVGGRKLDSTDNYNKAWGMGPA